MADLANLRKEDFEKCKGQAFSIAVESDELDEGFQLEVSEVESLKTDSEAREPFSVTFRGPKDPVLQQAALPLRHEALGEVTIFLVPIAQEEDSTLYEAIFS